MTEYIVAIRIEIKKDYRVEAETLEEAMETALNSAGNEYEGADLFVD